MHDFSDELRLIFQSCIFVFCVLPGAWNLDFNQGIYAAVDSLPVHLDDLCTLAAVGLLNRLLEQLDGFVDRQYLCQLEEGCLHDHVDSVAKTDFSGDGDSVDDVEVDVVFGKVALH